MSHSRTLWLVSDTRAPINGVGVLLSHLVPSLEARGWRVQFGPDMRNRPTHAHVFTDGPAALAAVEDFGRRKIAWTQSYHTDWPALLGTMFPAGVDAPEVWGLLRRHYRKAAKVLTATQRLRDRLLQQRVNDTVEIWHRGVDPRLFRPHDRHKKNDGPDLDTPRLLYVGRISPEKGILDFLQLDPGFRHHKVIAGDGPLRAPLQERFPEVAWLGPVPQRHLPDLYRQSAALVMPSRFDTLGTVLMEAACCGCPAAGYPVQGPADVVVEGVTGALAESLATAVEAAIGLDRTAIAHAAKARFGWRRCVDDFLTHLVPALV